MTARPDRQTRARDRKRRRQRNARPGGAAPQHPIQTACDTETASGTPGDQPENPDIGHRKGTTPVTTENSRTPASADPGVDYRMVARARIAAQKHLLTTVGTDALVAAFRRLSKHGWLSQRIDPRTQYTMRPSRYTPAEQAVVIAELDWRKGFPGESAAEAAAIQADADRLRRTRIEPTVEPAPTTVEKDWFERTMTKSGHHEWTAERARDEDAARRLLAAIPLRSIKAEGQVSTCNSLLA